jgi:hypothetical protein
MSGLHSNQRQKHLLLKRPNVQLPRQHGCAQHGSIQYVCRLVVLGLNAVAATASGYPPGHSPLAKRYMGRARM